jgi:ELWxxDGT repeat protein
MYAFPSHALRHALRALSLGAFCAAGASADPAPAYLVKDILTVPTRVGRAGGPTSSHGDVAYFNGITSTTGQEIWKTDGTAEGTALVRDVWPGAGGGLVGGRMHPVDEPLLLTVSDGVHDHELWQSDGTAAGTSMVADIWPGVLEDFVVLFGGSSPKDVVRMGGTYYFSAMHPDSGAELWKSDGTEAGTALVKDILPGPTGSGASLLVVSGSTLFFLADDGVHGIELWKSDGTAAGTALVADIRPGSAGSNANHGEIYMRAYGSGVLFGADDGVIGYELWKSDGTAAGTVLVKDFLSGAQPGGPTHVGGRDGLLGGKVWFTAWDDSGYQQLFSSDGTTAGTTVLVPMVPFYEGAPGPLVDVAGTGFFLAHPQATGTGLWKTDGTAAGTVLVHDFFPISIPEDFCPYSSGPVSAVGLVFYEVVGCSEVGVLWRSDGTAAGTFPIAGDVSMLAVLDDALLFRNEEGELWRSDGTVAGTTRVTDFSTRSSTPVGGVEMGDQLFFVAEGPGTGRELWKSDGTAAGTQLVKDLLPSGSSNPEQLTVIGNTLFFTAATVTGERRDLWKSDGTAAGTVLVKDFGSGTPFQNGIQDGHPLVVANGKLYFAVMELLDLGRELWTSDGTTAGTVLLKDINPGFLSGAPQWITNVGGTLFFAAAEGATGTELWKSDGTTAGTVLVKDIRTGSGSSAPALLVAHGGLLYFSANDGVSGAELWRSDGTAAGTFAVKDIQPGADGSKPEELISAGGALYFRASTAANGSELWKSDGTAAGTALVRDIRAGATGSTPSTFRALPGRLAFRADDGVHGLELWTSDGSEAGTLPIDLRPGSASSLSPVETFPPPAFAVVDGRLVLAADDGDSGEELWVSDGTVAGTRRVSDVADTGGSQPSEIAVAGDLVFFSASQPGAERELFAVPRLALLDSDGDGLDDFSEGVHGTNPLVMDSDGDDLSDGAEVHAHGTDPLDADSDDDGSSDGLEVNVLGSDPLDPNDPPAIPALGGCAAALLALLLVAAMPRWRRSPRPSP